MPRALTLAFLALLPFTLALDGFAVAEDVASADRVEEDWEVVIAAPDPNVSGPQITTSMKVDPSNSSPVAVFNLNYRDTPSFIAGGVQVKIRDGDRDVEASSQGSASFQTNDETVTWTQRMGLADGNLSYKIASGKSTTWGDFGANDGDLAIGAPTSLTSLAGYSPDDSVKGSGPSFGSNRLTRMTLLRVRYYRGQTLLATDETPRPVKLSD